MSFKAYALTATTAAAAGLTAGLYFGIAIGFNQAAQLQDNPLRGPATAYDGDTITITNELGQHNVRIWGADAVEARQTCRTGATSIPCGKLARDLTRALLAQGDVNCEKKEDRDRYGRYVAICYAADGTDIGRNLVQQGYAIEYKEYSDGRYAADEAAARRARRGIWATEFQMPADWRRCHTGAVDTRPQNCPAP